MGAQQNNGLGHTFDAVPQAYDRFRPAYVDELYRDLLALHPLDGTCRALEIGAGTGQATEPILRTGCAVTALEPGANLAAFLAAKFAEDSGLSVKICRFEDFSAPSGSYDLIYSATAFHWVDPDTGYSRAFDLLKPGGLFARFANHPFPAADDPALFEAIQTLYGAYYGRERAPERGSEEEMAKNLARLPEGYGFVRTGWKLYHRTRTLSPEEYVGLLGTYSDHLALEPARREAFFSGIRAAIEAHGDRIAIRDTIDLEFAVKPE